MKNDPGTEVTEELLRRICGEYMEMPGLRVTEAQAQRLWGLDEHTCASLLAFLVELRFLYRTGDGRFARLTEGRISIPPFRMAKAQLDVKPVNPQAIKKPSAA